MKFKNVEIYWLGHASFKLKWNNVIVYIDPYNISDEKGDIILVTHDHFDHCDKSSIEKLRKENTIIIAPKNCGDVADKIVEPGSKIDVMGIKIEVVHSYNIGKEFHPKGKGVGYIVDFEGTRVYHPGDSDFIPEMKEIKEIDIALLPIGGTYTMDENGALEVVRTIRPKIVIPMHYNTFPQIKKDPNKFKELVGNLCEVIVHP